MTRVLKNIQTLKKMLVLETDIIRQVVNKNKSCLYAGYPGLISEFGQPFLDKTKSPFMGTPRECYKNCFEALFCFKDFIYCEGYACSDKTAVLTPHAWLLNRDFQVIEPTWDKKLTQNIAYFGIGFSRSYVFESVNQNQEYGILENYYRNDFKLLRDGFPKDALYFCPSSHKDILSPEDV
ncbi:MAG: hypothetical protein PUP93_09540 [Rhizonema sp. NSF051]|nr:hypothetical protein [Rhizonema sp. NSF051]